MEGGVHWTQPEMEAIPRKWLEAVVHFLSGFRNDTVDFGRPHLRPSVEGVYPLFVVLYAALVLAGTSANVALLAAVLSPGAALPGTAAARSRRRSHPEPPRTVSGATAKRARQLQVDGEASGADGVRAEESRRRRSVVRVGGEGRDPTLCFLANVAIADAIKCLMVLPVSLAVLLVQNWVFGSFLCFFLPMMQDIPIHVTMLSFVLIAADRHRLLMDPMKPRLPPLFCSVSAWLLALCIVLPYPFYTTYLDLGEFKKEQFEGVGICAVNLGDDLQEYTRGLFIAMYVLPLAVIAFLYVRVSRELKMLRQDAGERAALAARSHAATASLGVGSRGHTPVGSRSPRDSLSTAGPRADMGRSASSCGISGDLDTGREAILAMASGRNSRSSRGGLHDGYAEEPAADTLETEMDIQREQRTQKYLIAMVVVFAICLFPLMVLRLAKLALTETYENSGHFDIAFIMFVWVAFLPTLSTPGLYYYWTLNSATKERLLEYLHLGSLRRRGPEEEVEEQGEPQGEGGTSSSGCAALLLGSRRGPQKKKNQQHEVCRITLTQQPHHHGNHSASSDNSSTTAMGLSNVGFAHPTPPPGAASPRANSIVDNSDMMGSPFGKGPFS
ncbi:5-hydroxytryptamine receptor 1-like [Ischnura elegans]|uniref:5-hydroxytryptamine receptor 1-like n=1 Tax=Ischnura elegans TaxID=197161 RepID=UPI001ED8AB6B|nr:5-hydroxytryptamine receptor 1-like [Ischnura elegans]